MDRAATSLNNRIDYNSASNFGNWGSSVLGNSYTSETGLHYQGLLNTYKMSTSPQLSMPTVSGQYMYATNSQLTSELAPPSQPSDEVDVGAHAALSAGWTSGPGGFHAALIPTAGQGVHPSQQSFPANNPTVADHSLFMQPSSVGSGSSQLKSDPSSAFDESFTFGSQHLVNHAFMIGVQKDVQIRMPGPMRVENTAANVFPANSVGLFGGFTSSGLPLTGDTSPEPRLPLLPQRQQQRSPSASSQRSLTLGPRCPWPGCGYIPQASSGSDRDKEFQRNLRKHIKRQHNTEPTICPQCWKQTLRPENHIAHMRTHSRPKRRSRTMPHSRAVSWIEASPESPLPLHHAGTW
jgi:hypothetical protein